MRLKSVISIISIIFILKFAKITVISKRDVEQDLFRNVHSVTM